MSKELFILGAGFNLDANKYIDPKNYYFLPSANDCHNPPLEWETKQLPCAYPKVDDLVHACFGPGIDLEKSAEKLFTQAYKNAEWIPLERLVDIIQAADYYIASNIIYNSCTPYMKFFQHFKESHFISYNYDCLAELHLQILNHWHPRHGFGIEALYFRNPIIKGQNFIPMHIVSSIVLHLHGSLYLYPIESYLSTADATGTRWLTLRSHPRFIFDPDSLSDAYPKFVRPVPGHDYVHPVARFIPPIFDKSMHLKETYYELLIKRAIQLLHKATTVISIGYSFAENDSQSYDTLLKKLFNEDKKLLVISPSADQIVHKIKAKYHSYSPSVISIPMTFSKWVAEGFPRGTL